MTDPTRMVPPADGPSSTPPTDGPPPSGPPTGGPGGPDGPDGPDGPGGPDRRRMAVYVMIGLIALALLVLIIVVLAGGDGGGDDGETDGSSTTVSPTTTTTAPSSTSASTTTSTTTTTTTPSTTTTTTSTTTTTAPPTTIDLQRCNGDAPPEDPEPVAQVFYDAWTVDDRECAQEVASQDAIDTLFAIDGSDANWTPQGCEPDEDAGPTEAECAFRYEGGTAFFDMRFHPIDGWSVETVRFVVD